MAHKDIDRVLETSDTIGSGPVILAGRVLGYRSLVDGGIVDGDTVDMYVEDVFPANGVPTGNWECGTYTWRTGGVLERTIIRASSMGATPINWGVGTRRIGAGLLAYMLTAIRSVNTSLSAVQTVATDVASVNTVAAASTQVVAVGNSIANVNTVAPSIANVNTVAPSIANVNAVGPSIANVNTVAPSIANVDTVAASIANVNTTAVSIANVNAVGPSIANVNTVAPSIASVNTVAPSIANVNTVAGSIASVNTVAPSIANVNTTAGSIASVNTVAPSIANVNTVAPSIANVNTVAGSIANVNLVGPSIASVNTTAGSIAAVNNVSTNIVVVQNATSSAAAAANSATQANTFMLSAIAQASLASLAALAASSVLAQDLSGVQAGALHRSPNAIVAQCLMDTSRDSDPGWILRMQDKSWENEALGYGAYLGAHANETLARFGSATLGAELLSNGTFANGFAGWVPNTANNTSTVGGRLKVTALVGGSSADSTLATIPVTAGKTYRVSAGFIQAYDASGNVDASARARIAISVSAGTLTTVASTSGIATRMAAPVIATADPSVQYVTPSATGNLFLTAETASNSAFAPINYSAQFDDISVKEVTAMVSGGNAGNGYQLASDGKFYRLWDNILPFSERFDQWTRANIASVTVDADGTSDKIIPSAVSATHSIQAPGTPISAIGLPAVKTVRAKADGYNFVAIEMSGATSAYFNLGTGAVGTVSAGMTASIAAVSGMAGYYDCTISGTVTSSAGGRIYVAAADNTPTFTGDGVSGVLVNRAHCRYGTTVGTYEAKADATTGQSEVLNGNSRQFPRLGYAVAEASRVVVYDLLQPGKPMWKVFAGNTNSVVRASVTGIAYREGQLWIAQAATNGQMVVDFAKDGEPYLLGASGTFKNAGIRNIAQRNNTSAAWIQSSSFGAIANSTVNAVAMTTMPDAPVDPVTGLQVPTIGCFTAGGISIIQNDGTVRNSSSTANFVQGVLNRYMVAAVDNTNANFHHALNPGSLGAAFATTLGSAGTGINGFVKSTSRAQALMGRGRLAKASNAAQLSLLMMNESATGSSLSATITDTSNTGLMVGDIRRTLLSDVTAGTMDGTEKLQSWDFSAATGWTLTNGAGGETATISGGSLSLQRGASTFGTGVQSYATVIGQLYQITVVNNGAVAANVRAGVSSMSNSNGEVATTAGQTVTSSFTATATTTFISAFANVTGTASLDSISVKEAVADRSYKAKPLTVNGTIAKTAVAAAAQLVAYSGWSASNYLREAYSADLDFGTGAWRGDASVSYTTAVASTIWHRGFSSGASLTLGTDATGKLTGTAFDGTTTRTVTSTAAYNTGTFLKAALEYATSGSLTLKVNGAQIAQTTGAPLLTMNNASAVLTVGQNFDLTAPFPGSIALVHLGATTATAEQEAFAYEQERQMFRDGAQVTLPDSGALVDMAYDDRLGVLMTASAANESTISGLVRTATAPSAAGSISKVLGGDGFKMVARTTTNPGVDVTEPSQNLKAALLRRAEAGKRDSAPSQVLDWVGGFTATTAVGSALLTSVAGLSIPAGVTARGAQISGSGIPVGTTILEVVGTTIHMSAAATLGAAGVAVSFLEIVGLPGFEFRTVAHDAGVAANGLAGRTEGVGKDWTRKFDGFLERTTFATAPGTTARIQGQLRKAVTQ